MNYTDWEVSKADVFWGEIAPCSHILQIYENDEIFLNSLVGFVVGGINMGDSVIVIATENHLKELDQKLTSIGLQVDELLMDLRYIPLIAETVLDKFMVNGWPDEDLFNRTISEVLTMVKEKSPVRAFGEMVAILWSQGHTGATVLLEHLWNKFCEKESLRLFCSYPSGGFTEEANESLRNICRHHSTLIAGFENSSHEILHRKSA